MNAFRFLRSFRIHRIFSQSHAVGHVHGTVVGFHRSFRHHAVLHIQVHGLLDVLSAVENYNYIIFAERDVVKSAQFLCQSRRTGVIPHDVALILAQRCSFFGIEDHIEFLCPVLHRKGITGIPVQHIPGVVVHAFRVGKHIAIAQLDAFRGHRRFVLPAGIGLFRVAPRGRIHRGFRSRRFRNGSALIGHHAFIGHHVLKVSGRSGFAHAAELNVIPHHLFQHCLVAVEYHYVLITGSVVQLRHLLGTGFICPTITPIFRYRPAILYIQDFIHLRHMAALLVDNGHGTGVAAAVQDIASIKIQSFRVGKGVRIADLQRKRLIHGAYRLQGEGGIDSAAGNRPPKTGRLGTGGSGRRHRHRSGTVIGAHAPEEKAHSQISFCCGSGNCILVVVKFNVGFLDVIPIVNNEHHIAVTFAVAIFAVIILAQVIVSANGIRLAVHHITLVLTGTFALVGVQNLIDAFYRIPLVAQAAGHVAAAVPIQYIAGIKTDICRIGKGVQPAHGDAVAFLPAGAGNGFSGILRGGLQGSFLFLLLRFFGILQHFPVGNAAGSQPGFFLGRRRTIQQHNAQHHCNDYDYCSGSAKDGDLFLLFHAITLLIPMLSQRRPPSL